jgi:hypothetical protein
VRQRTLITLPALALAALAAPAGALAHEREHDHGHRDPAVTITPTVAGVPQVGETLTADPGEPAGDRRSFRRARWLRCDASGAACERLHGHGSSYVLTPEDAYRTIRVRVTRVGPWGVIARGTSAPTEVVLTAQPGGPRLLLQDFAGADGLVTNDYAYRHPGAVDAVRSPDWFLTNGSLFRRGGVGWTGVPDNGVTDAGSTTATHSASFRLLSQRGDLDSTMVSLSASRVGLTSTSSTPAVPWDGAHVVLRWQSLASFYSVSFDRRDGLVAIKKKVAGGVSNGGTYTTLAWRSAPQAGWQHAKAVAHTNDDGSVTLGLFREDRLVLSVTDRGAGGAAPLGAGHAGVYGDNAELELDDLAVDLL